MLRGLAFWLALWLGAAGAVAQQPPSQQQGGWPDRPVRVIMPYPAGGGGDAVARVMAQKLGEIFNQRFFVENRPGASGMVGAAAVAKAEPDGYTLLVCSPAEVALAPNLFKDMSYDPLKELAPVTLIAWTPLVIAAHPSFEASTPAELIQLAKSKPTDYSHPGVGSSHHLTGEYFNKLLSGKLVPVPYRGAAPAVTDAVGGQVKLTIAGMPPVVPFLQSGALKAIAVTSKQRSPLFPNVPAMAETKGFEDFDFTNWFGLLAPSGTPAAIIERLHKASVEALKDAKVHEILMTQAAEPIGSTPAEFGAFIRSEAEKYARLVQATGVKPN